MIEDAENYENAYIAMNIIAKPSNKIKCCPNIILAIHATNRKAIKSSIVMRKYISHLCFFVNSAIKYAIIMMAAMTIIKIRKYFMRITPSFSLLYHKICHRTSTAFTYIVQ